jgi:hypothetical protein
MKMQNWDIMPYKGVGLVLFGIRSAEAEELLGSNAATFKKGPHAVGETKAYDELGLHLHYDSKDRLECIEAFGSCPLAYKGLALLNKNIEPVLEILTNLGLGYRYDDGYFIDTEGFALYAPDGVVKGVTVYRKGYYQ